MEKKAIHESDATRLALGAVLGFIMPFSHAMPVFRYADAAMPVTASLMPSHAFFVPPTRYAASTSGRLLSFPSPLNDMLYITLVLLSPLFTRYTMIITLSSHYRYHHIHMRRYVVFIDFPSAAFTPPRRRSKARQRWVGKHIIVYGGGGGAVQVAVRRVQRCVCR